MKITIFRSFTGVIGVYHVLLGLAALLLPTQTFINISGWILGLRPQADAQFQLIASFSAAYIISFGIMMLLLTANPVKFRILAIPALTLFGIRFINKVVLFNTIGDQFNVSPGRNIFATACIAVLFFGILFTLPKEHDQQSPQ